MQGELVWQLGIPHGKAYTSAACRARIHGEWVVEQVELLDVPGRRSREKGLALRKLLNTRACGRHQHFHVRPRRHPVERHRLRQRGERDFRVPASA